MGSLPHQSQPELRQSLAACLPSYNHTGGGTISFLLSVALVGKRIDTGLEFASHWLRLHLLLASLPSALLVPMASSPTACT